MNPSYPETGNSQLRAGCLGRLLTLATTLLMFASGSAGATPAPTDTENARVPNRYLIIVETSEAMAKRAGGVVQILRGMLESGMRGELQDGDSIGLWTYNNELNAGGMAVQHWVAGQQNAVTTRTLKYLTSQPLENKARFNTVAPAMDKVIKSSKYITVILFTDGTQKLTGTGLDDEINASIKKWRSKQAKDQPFVTILRAAGGVVTGFVVTPSSFRVEFPPYPEELKPKPPVAVAEKPAPKPAPTPAPVARGNPLIVTGSKPKPVEPLPTPQVAQNVSSAPAIPPTVETVPTPAANPTPAPSLPVAQPTENPPPTAPPREAANQSQVAPATLTPTAAAQPESTPAPIQPAPTPPAKDEPGTVPPPLPGKADLRPSTPAEPAATPEPPVVPPVQVAVADSSANLRLWLAAGGGLVLLCGVIAALLIHRRSRRNQPVSLITESFDRNQQP